MAHIQLPEGLPCIRGPMVFLLCDIALVLLTGSHTLTPAEREMIAMYVSSQNAGNSPSFPVAQNCGMGSSSLNAEVNALDRVAPAQ